MRPNKMQQQKLEISVKDKKRLLMIDALKMDPLMGRVVVDLGDVSTRGKINEWYPLE